MEKYIKYFYEFKEKYPEKFKEVFSKEVEIQLDEYLTSKKELELINLFKQRRRDGQKYSKISNG